MRFGIAQKVNLLSVSIILAFGISMGIYFINEQSKVLNSELDDRVKILLSNLSLNLEYPVLINDQEAIVRLLEGVLAQQDVVSGRITNKNGNLLYQKDSKKEGPIEEFASTIVTKRAAEGTGEDLILGIQEEAEEVVGKIYLKVSLLELNRKIDRIKNTVIIVIITAIVILSLASYLLLKFVLDRPISRLVNATKRVASGELAYQVPVKSNDEIGILAFSFNQMTKHLRDTMVSRDYVDTIIDSMNDTLIIVDTNGKISRINRATEELLGYSESELIQKPVEVLMESDNLYLRSSELTELVKAGFIQNTETNFLSKQGNIIPVLLSSSAMHNKDGKMQGMVFLALDITERKRMEEELLKNAGELERSNKDLEQFAYVASHDLQEPLRMVASYLQLITRRYQGKLDETADEFIAYAVDGADRMRRMINDLLIYSRVGTKGKPFELTDCEDVLNQSIANLEMAIKESGAVVTHDPLPHIMADGAQLVQLFQNLIGNSVKFSKEESSRVHISAAKKGVEWIFSVQDNGIGIEPQYMERIFQIFQRLHGVGEYPGTGIGLAVCRRIVERHGGRIWVESKPGNGTTFYFTIPIKGV